ncbi:Mss4-like protein [Schizophyllum commune]
MSSGSCSGRCLCGAVQCRLWTGSICLTAVCFPASAVFFLVDSVQIPYHNPPPALKSYTSSPGVVRQFCGTCGSSMFYHDDNEGRDGPNEKEGVVHVSAGTLKEFKDVNIRSQIFCENLIPGMGVGPVGEGVDMLRTREGRWEVGEENGKEG